MYYLCSKTKAQISCAVIGQLICVFVFAYAKSKFFHNTTKLVSLFQTFGGPCSHDVYSNVNSSD